MKFFKKHIKETIFLFVVLVIALSLGVLFLVMWFGGGNNKYGSRLEGIEEVSVSNSYLKEVVDQLEKKSIVKNATVNLQGKLINFNITLKESTLEADAKALSAVVIDNFTKDELSFYDIQIFLLDNKEESIYPMIGYKHRTNAEFVWSNHK